MTFLPRLIVTHPHVDLDAASCVALLVLQDEGRLEDVVFLPANEKKLPFSRDRCLVVDHPLGLKGERSALAELPGAVELLGEEFVKEVDRHDSGSGVDGDWTLSHIFGAFRTGLTLRGFAPEEKDRKLLSLWCDFVRGHVSMRNQWKRASEAAPDVPLVRVGPYLFAASLRSLPPGTHSILQEQGVTGLFYQSDRGIGMHRFKGEKKPDLRKMGDRLPGWYVDEREFLVCWGSKKAPMTSPPPKGTPQSMEELIELAKEVFTV